MAASDKVLGSIYEAVDEANQVAEDGARLDKSPETVLFGRASKLDSLGLVTLIVGIEQKIHENFNADITIADEKAFSQKNSPFRTIGTLAEYITTLLGEKAV